MPPKKRRRREDSDPSNYPSPSQPPSSSHRPRRVAAELADALRRASLDLHSPRRPLPSPSSSLSFTPSSDDDVADTHTETWPLPYRGGATPAPPACARIAHTESHPPPAGADSVEHTQPTQPFVPLAPADPSGNYDYSSLVQTPASCKCPVSGCLHTFHKKASLTAHLRNTHKGTVLDSTTESQLQLSRCPKCTGYYCSAGVNAHAAGCRRGATPARTPLAAQLNSNRAQQSLVPPPPPHTSNGLRAPRRSTHCGSWTLSFDRAQTSPSRGGLQSSTRPGLLARTDGTDGENTFCANLDTAGPFLTEHQLLAMTLWLSFGENPPGPYSVRSATSLTGPSRSVLSLPWWIT